jgi:transposase
MFSLQFRIVFNDVLNLMQSRITMSQEIKKRTSQKPETGYLKYSVGIDIGKDKFDVCISIIDKMQHVKVLATRDCNNNPVGFKTFIEWQNRKCKLDVPTVFTMEATGIYYEKLAWFLHRQGLYVSVVLPNKARKYMQCLGLKSKNDSIDALGLARMGAEQYLLRWNAPKEIVMQLRDITRQRESLQESKTRFNNQLSAYSCGEFVNDSIVKNLKEIIALLDRQIKETEKMIKDTVNSDNEIKERVGKILDIKGVSDITIATVIAETNCFEMFSNHRQLVSYSGYDIVENQSGKHVGKTKISKKGNAHIRRILHMPAFNVVAYGEPVFVNLYERVYERTNVKMKGYVAVQRELLCLIYALWKKNEKYDKNFKGEHPAMQSRSSSFRVAS